MRNAESLRCLQDQLADHNAILSITGMTCASCAESVSAAAAAIFSQENQECDQNCSINLIHRTAVVCFLLKH